MLTNVQLRKLARGMSDIQICRDPMTEKEKKDDDGDVLWTYNEIIACEQAWGHGALLIFEPKPDRTNGKASVRDRSAEIVESFADDLEKTDWQQAWPIEIAGTEHQSVITFATLDGDEYTINADYVGTVLKKNAKNLNALQWHAGKPTALPCVMAELVGQIRAVIASMVMPIEEIDCIWNLRNADLPQPISWQPEPIDADLVSQPNLF